MALMGLRKRFLVVVVGVPGSPAEAQRSEVGRFRSMSAAEQAGQDEWRRILFVHAPHVDRYRIVIEDDGVEVGEVPMPELPADAGPGILDETVTPLGTSVGALGEPLEEAPVEDVEVDDVEVEEAAVEVADVAPGDAPPAPDVAVEAVAVAGVAAEVVAGQSEPEPEPEPAVQAVVATEVDADAEAEAIEATGELEVIPDEDELAATGEHKGLADEVAMDDVSATGEVPIIPPEGDGVPAAPAQRPYIEIEDPPDGPVPEDVIARFAAMVEADKEREARRAERERGDAG